MGLRRDYTGKSGQQKELRTEAVRSQRLPGCRNGQNGGRIVRARKQTNPESKNGDVTFL